MEPQRLNCTGTPADFAASFIPASRAAPSCSSLAPGYQLCYAVGRRDLLRLREDYRKRAGSSFSLRTFHDELMRYGGLPVTLIRWGMGL